MMNEFSYHLDDATGDVTIHARQRILEDLIRAFPDLYASEDCVIIPDPSADKEDIESILLAQRCY